MNIGLIFRLLITPLVLLLLVAVSNAQPTIQSGLEFSAHEYEYIDQLREKGGLKVAIDPGPGIYMTNSDGSIDGFHYRLLRAFSDLIDVPLIIKEVSVGDFFLKDGALPEGYRSDPDVAYTPDVLADSDLLVSSITINSWRQKLMIIVPVFPVKLLLITRKGEEIQHITDLSLKTIATREAYSYTDVFQQLDAEFELQLNYVYAENSDSMFQAVEQGIAFATANDSDAAIVSIREYETLNISQPLTDIEFAGWGVGKDAKLMASIIEKYIEHAKNEGSFNNIWRAEHGIDFNDYLRILEY